MPRMYSSLAEALQAQNDPRWERPFLCPVHDDHRASASVNVQKGLWLCYTCGAKGTTEGIYYEPQLDLQFLDELLEEPRVLPERILDLYYSGTPHPYWLTRFSEKACFFFQLGTDPHTGRPCYPIRDEFGQLLGICTRNLDDDGPKYRYPRGIKVKDYLFNYSPVTEQVVLVEGAADAIALWDAGISGAMAIYGSSLSDQQVRLLRATGADRVVLAFDNDRAGRKCRDASHERLGWAGEVVAFDWSRWDDYGDVAEMPRHLRIQAFRELT